jgi:1-acyl-sn-glycerol-3-phosphate acyltransferase
MAPFVGGRRAFWLAARQYALHVAKVFGMRHEMQGWEALPEDLRKGRQSAIFIANHVSNLDPIMLACRIGCQPTFVAKLEVAFVPVLGAVTWLSGAIFINRRNRKQAILSMQRAARKIRDGVCIIAFPEGTRSRTGLLARPFKKGVFNMARQAGVPVVPLGLIGGFEAMPPGAWQCKPGPFLIRVGAPIHPEAFPDTDAFRVAAEEAMEALVTS